MNLKILITCPKKDNKTIRDLGLTIFFSLFSCSIAYSIETNLDKDTYEIRWELAPQTYFANQLFKYESNLWDELNNQSGVNEIPKNLLRFHQVNNKLIKISNKNIKNWPFTLVFTIIGIIFSFLLYKLSYLRFLSVLSFLINILGLFGFTLLFPKPGNLGVTFLYLIGILGGSVSAILSGAYLLRTNRNRSTNKLLYGKSIKNPKDSDGFIIGNYSEKVLPKYVRWISNNNEDQISIPFNKLSQGVSIIGDMGSGKTRLLMKFHDELRTKYPNIPILIHDPKGEWYKTYFDPKTDVIFSPHMKGSSGWSIVDDFNNKPELFYQVLNTAVYARQNNDDVFWSDNAVNLLKNAFSQKTLKEALDYLVFMKEKSNGDRFFMSVYGTAKMAMTDIIKVETDFQNKINQPGPKSIDDYLNHKGRIFLLNNPAFAAEQKGIFNLFLSMFFLRAISMPDVNQGELRAVAIIDEILSFNMPPDIARSVFTISRSKGLSIISAAQRMSKENKNEISEWINSEYLISMKIIDRATQESISKRAGQIQYEKKVKTVSRGEQSKRSVSESIQVQKDTLIPPEYFSNLNPREFILFHQGGISPGISAEVNNHQGSINLPIYEQKKEAQELVSVLD